MMKRIFAKTNLSQQRSKSLTGAAARNVKQDEKMTLLPSIFADVSTKT